MNTISSDIAIQCENLGKMYRIYSHPYDILREMISKKKFYAESWALKDVSFEVKRGEIMGVIGPNGAGKSTLLKILSGTLSKTTGSLTVNGKISAILELGTGFNPNHTGRENVIMGATCLGMSQKDIAKKLDWIIDFSELHSVIDRPFHTYSSGMQGRLTFATAISIEPDILIIDEALATGDTYFVHKCMTRVREICKSGATVLFVTHSEGLVMDLCDRAMWLSGGGLKAIGPAEPVAKAYVASVWRQEEERNILENAQKSESVLNETLDTGKYELNGGNIKIIGVQTWNAERQPVTIFKNGESMFICIDWEGYTEDPLIYSSFRVDGPQGQAITGYDAYQFNDFINNGEPLNGKGRVIYKIPSLHLGEGKYHLSVSICKHMIPKGKEAFLHYIEKVHTFSVQRRVVWPVALSYEPEIETIYEQLA